MNIHEGSCLLFTDEQGEETRFYIQEQTRVNGTNYILVADSEEDEAQAYILKDTSMDGDETAAYVMVEDEVEFDAIADVFRRMMEEADVDLI